MDNLFEKRISDIPTLFTKRHAHVAYGLVRSLQPSAIVEIGSFAGYMTAVLAKGCLDNGEGIVYAIDNFTLGTTATHLHNNMQIAGVAQHVMIVEADSQKLEQVPNCDLAFIDGDHSYHGLVNDINLCLNAGATTLLIHDTRSWWGPNKLLTELREGIHENKEFEFIEFPYDGGFLVMQQKVTLLQPQYTEEKYPTGVVN